MAIPETMLRHAWAWAGGECECKHEGHGHVDRCGSVLKWEKRGKLVPGGWQVTLQTPVEQGGTERAENCVILCLRCYRKMEKKAAA